MHKELSKYGTVDLNKSFKTLTTLKVGGDINVYFEPYNMYNLVLALDYLKENNINYKVIGNGSNLLCSDDFYDGVIIKLSNLNHFELNDNEMYVEAGVPIIVASNFAINNGYSGLEFANAIPALMGGIIYMNASAYNESISDVIKNVLVYNNKKLVWMDKEDLEFEYRKSIFQNRKDLIIVAVNLLLKADSVDRLKQISIDRNQRRFKTQPFNYPNCGSVFVNNDDIVAWKIIDDLGLRGKQIGNAMISDKHCNFICNLGSCSASDVNDLISLAISKSSNENIKLELEVEKFNW